MLTDKQNRFISDTVYELDYLKRRNKEDLNPGNIRPFNVKDKSEGNYIILKVEDNQENGMQAMAVAPIGADGQPDYSQIIITYAGTNF